MKKKVVVMNPLLEKALKGYVPEPANEDDIRIVNDLTKLHRKLLTINSELFRDLQFKKSLELTPKMREIEREEKYLIERIYQRNLDF